MGNQATGELETEKSSEKGHVLKGTGRKIKAKEGTRQCENVDTDKGKKGGDAKK